MKLWRWLDISIAAAMKLMMILCAGTRNNFKKYSSARVTDYGVPYDYGSIMHYSSHAFSRNGKPTITPLVSPYCYRLRDQGVTRNIVYMRSVDWNGSGFKTAILCCLNISLNFIFSKNQQNTKRLQIIIESSGLCNFFCSLGYLIVTNWLLSKTFSAINML